MWAYELAIWCDDSWITIDSGSRRDVYSFLINYPADARGYVLRLLHVPTQHRQVSNKVRDLLVWLASPERLLESEWIL